MSGGGADRSGGRFQKGQTGNPKGRPRKSLDVRAEGPLAISEQILRVAAESVNLTENGKAITLTSTEAVMKALRLAALKGSPHAQRSFLSLVQSAEADSRTRLIKELEMAYAVRREIRIARERWVLSGRAEADMPIHPDDVVIGSDGKITYYVALSDEQEIARRELMQLRAGAWHLLYRTDRLIRWKLDDALTDLERQYAFHLLEYTEHVLPPRLRCRQPGDLEAGARGKRFRKLLAACLSAHLNLPSGKPL